MTETIWAFDSFAAFIAMGKHGVYVWSAYGIYFGLVTALIVFSYFQFASWRDREMDRIQRTAQQQAHQDRREILGNNNL